MVCVHGLTRNARDFDYLAQTLAAQGTRVLAISMAGRGESDRLTDPMHYSYPTYVADCLAFLDNFHLRNIDWVGTSMGGIIGMMLAASSKHRIRRLVLNDIGSFLNKAALQRIYGYVQNIPESFANHEAAEAYFKANFAPWGITEDAHWQHFMQHSIAAQADGSYRMLCDPAIAQPLAAISENFTKVEDINLADIWSQLLIPTLILRGADSDILDEVTIEAMKRTNPDTNSMTFEGCGHAPALATEYQIGYIARFLQGSGSAVRAIGI